MDGPQPRSNTHECCLKLLTVRRRDKAWYLMFAHARVTLEFHRRRLSSYTFAVCDEYSSIFIAVREALLYAIYSDDCIVSSFLKL